MWGRVSDVFISRRLDSGKRRFGFVSFQGVLDVRVLERKLDAIWIGLWKLRVNIPKFSRKEPNRPEVGDGRRMELAKKVWRQKDHQRTFAQVVRDGHESDAQKVLDANMVCVQVAVDSTKWLEDCFVV